MCSFLSKWGVVDLRMLAPQMPDLGCRFSWASISEPLLVRFLRVSHIFQTWALPSPGRCSLLGFYLSAWHGNQLVSELRRTAFGSVQGPLTMLGLVIFRSGINVVLAKSQHGVEE